MALFFLPSNAEKEVSHSHVDRKSIKIRMATLETLDNKKQWLTDIQKSLLFVSVVELFYWAINSSIVSSHMIMLIRSIWHF